MLHNVTPLDRSLILQDENELESDSPNMDSGDSSILASDGSIMHLINASGFAVSYSDYDVYGTTQRSSVSTDIPYKFTGQEFDQFETTGMYNFRARFYSDSTAIFNSDDPAHSSTSPYGYVGGNPVSFTDPTGMVKNPMAPPPDYLSMEADWLDAQEIGMVAGGGGALSPGGSGITFADASGSSDWYSSYEQDVAGTFGLSGLQYLVNSGWHKPISGVFDPWLGEGYQSVFNQLSNDYRQRKVSQIIQNLTTEEKRLLTALGAAEASPRDINPQEIAGIIFSVFNRLAAGYGNAKDISEVVFYPDAYNGVTTPIFFYALNGYLPLTSTWGTGFVSDWNRIGASYTFNSYDSRISTAMGVVNGIVSGSITNPVGGSEFFHSINSGTWNSTPWNTYVNDLQAIYLLGGEATPAGWEQYSYGNTVFINWNGLK
jgi:RHS repeat-associated protein